MKTYREKSDRDSFSIPSAWTSAPTLPAPTHASLLMQQVEALEAAKRRAAASYTRMVAHPMPQDMAQTTRDEQEVLCARVAVLNALLEQTAEHSPLCLEATGRERPRVCVTYDRLRCDGELELGPMQSTMAWVVRDAEDPVTQLMSCPDDHPPASVVNGLLDLIRKSAPKKDILQGLHSALTLPPPERLVLKSLRGVNAPEHDGHARVYEGLGESASGPVPPLYRVIWGALDLHVLEGWQNPSTNAAIRLSILDAAHQAAREAQRTKAPLWSNVAYLQVRIYHGEECHRLSLRPFWDSESCTVSHIQFRQSVFDESGPERGLLNLSQDPTTIHSIPMGTILPLQAYVCLGAHRKNRLNEAQLNYVHAQGLLAHRFDVRLLPDPGLLLQTPSGKMVPAKATRVSGDKLDVMASSYHIADQVYTTISVVQYPPFGTQFEKASDPQKTCEAKTALRTRTERRPRNHARHQLSTQESSNLNPDSAQFTVGDWNKGGRSLPREDRNYQEYLQARDTNMEAFKGKAWTWDEDLCLGEHFFIDGIYGSPYEPQYRFILYEIDNGNRYQQVKEKLADIKSILYQKYDNQGWDPTLSFYGNIDTNEDIHDTWNTEWTKFLRDHYSEVLTDGHDEENVSVAFWFAEAAGNWDRIFYKADERRVSNKYKAHQQELLDYWRDKGHLSRQMNDRKVLLLPARTQTYHLKTNADQLPLPLTRLSARTAGKDPGVDQLKSRITALEGRLDRARQEENTQFLLCKVLEKLEAVEEV